MDLNKVCSSLILFYCAVLQTSCSAPQEAVSKFDNSASAHRQYAYRCDVEELYLTEPPAIFTKLESIELLSPLPGTWFIGFNTCDGIQNDKYPECSSALGPVPPKNSMQVYLSSGSGHFIEDQILTGWDAEEYVNFGVGELFQLQILKDGGVLLFGGDISVAKDQIRTRFPDKVGFAGGGSCRLLAKPDSQ